MQRYTSGNSGYMHEDPDGEYVRYEDVVTLVQPATLVLEWIRAGRFTDEELEAIRAQICVTLPT